jgi:endonuclease III
LPDEDTTFKIQALDCDDLFERLKLASDMLRAKKADLKEKMKKAGLPFRDEEDESK